MSTSLYWRPAPREVPPSNTLGGMLKSRIARRLWDHDGSLTEPEPLEVGKELMPYLEGLRDGGSGELSEDAAELTEAIREHGAVEIWIAE